jgi:hypothetical protein
MDTPMTPAKITSGCTYLCDDGSPGDTCGGEGEYPVHAICTSCGIPSDDIICVDHTGALAAGRIRCSYCLSPMASLDAVSLN